MNGLFTAGSGLGQPWGVLALLVTSGVFVALCTVVVYAWRLTHPGRKTAGWAIARGYASDPSELDTSPGFESYEVDLGEHARATPVWSIEGGDPDGVVLIMTPGWADSRIGQLTRAQHLLGACSRIVLWDPPAHGEAGMGIGQRGGRCWLGTREPAMLVRLVAHAHEQWGEERRVVLFGSSLGGGVSIVSAAELADDPRVVGVIAEAPYRHAITPARNVIRGFGYPTVGLLRCSFVLLGAVFGMSGWLSWFELDGGEFDRAKHAAAMGCHMLVLHGDADPVSPFEDGESLVAAAVDAELVRLAEGGHNNLWVDERLAPVVRGRCVEFLRTVAEKG